MNKCPKHGPGTFRSDCPECWPAPGNALAGFDEHGERCWVTQDRVDEYDRDEWWDLARMFRPDWTREQFDAEWDEFQARKAERQRARELS